MSLLEQSPNLHNHILQILEEQKQSREQLPGIKRFGTLSTGFILTHKRRKLTETSVPLQENEEENGQNDVGQDNTHESTTDDPDVEYYHKLMEECKQQELEQEQWARGLQQKVNDLRKVYLYGLSKM
jgi:hypothetical protein